MSGGHPVPTFADLKAAAERIPADQERVFFRGEEVSAKPEPNALRKIKSERDAVLTGDQPLPGPREIVYTHKGWFGICPIYLDGLGEGPTLKARHILLEPLFALSVWLMQQVIFFKSMGDPKWEPMFPIRITGALKKPFREPAH